MILQASSKRRLEFPWRVQVTRESIGTRDDPRKCPHGKTAWQKPFLYILRSSKKTEGVGWFRLHLQKVNVFFLQVQSYQEKLPELHLFRSNMAPEKGSLEHGTWKRFLGKGKAFINHQFFGCPSLAAWGMDGEPTHAIVPCGHQVRGVSRGLSVGSQIPHA